jgi:hypothetical protein
MLYAFILLCLVVTVVCSILAFGPEVAAILGVLAAACILGLFIDSWFEPRR